MSCYKSNVINPSSSNDQIEGMLKMVVLAKKGFKFAAPTNAETLADWITAIQAKNIIPLKTLMSSEPSNEGAQYEQTPLKTVFIRDGRMERKLQIDSNIDLHNKLRSLNADDWDVYLIFENGAIAAFKDGTAFAPYELDLLHVEYQTDNEGSVSSKTPIHMTFADPKQYQDMSIIVCPTWNPVTKLKPLKNVQLEVVSASATEIVFNAYVPHVVVGYKNPVESLVAADMTLLNGAGAAQVIGGMAPVVGTPGQYTITGTGLVTGTLNMVIPSLMTTKGLESVGAVTVTVA
jgi:hypothetical protein